MASSTGQLNGPGAGEARDWQRFESAQPNELWQMDFKGHMPMMNGRLHPLTVLDDCSRYALILAACGHERSEGIKVLLKIRFSAMGCQGVFWPTMVRPGVLVAAN